MKGRGVKKSIIIHMLPDHLVELLNLFHKVWVTVKITLLAYSLHSLLELIKDWAFCPQLGKDVLGQGKEELLVVRQKL